MRLTFGRAIVTFCLKIHRALRAAGLPYETRRAAMPRDFQHLNPTAQIPVLLVGEEPIYDSTRILQAIAELAPGTIEPASRRARAEAWLWEDFADRALNGYLVAARWADDKNWPFVRDRIFGGAPWFVKRFIAPRVRAKVVSALVARDVTRAGLDRLWEDFRRTLDHLELVAPEKGFWLGGARPDVADLAIFAQLRALRTHLTAQQSREIELRPALVDWLDRVEEATAPVSVRAKVAALRPSAAPAPLVATAVS
jgi:glutathione S-transferase